MKLEGTHVAMVTPFTKDNEIDEERYRSHIDFLIENGVDGLLAVGTTGESATISHDEHKKIIDILIDQVDGRVTTLAGAGSNSTAEAKELVKYAENVGADVALVITPYYNKPQQSGMYEHFKILNDTNDIPIMLYNVPSRTGVDLSVETICDLACLDNIVSIKEANPNLDKFAKLLSCLEKDGLNDNFKVLSGNDVLTVPMMAQGAVGLISVAANVDPRRMSNMVNKCLENDFSTASKLAYDLYDLMDVMFIEASPAPAKKALELMGNMNGYLRMPINEMSTDNEEILKNILIKDNLL
ncbi:MAG: 4-hydroxy-tetrahydrodipicolinate synthase [Methanobacteriaceae archaeon]|nr:4-hydroxy-tetrahydrodipicolinate synthase [Methanobacteriaceae archaeon]